MSKPRSTSNEVLKYSGMAFQMFAYLLIGWFIGDWLDGYFQLVKPYFALAIMMLFLVGFFYKLVKDLS